eukprot:4964128-Pleurochrysis_carterae.AAC.1
MWRNGLKVARLGCPNRLRRAATDVLRACGSRKAISSGNESGGRKGCGREHRHVNNFLAWRGLESSHMGPV